VSTKIAPFDQQTSPAEIRRRVTAYLQKLEDPAKGKQFLEYVKASKHIGWLVQSAARKKEIYAAEIFTCWKLVELVDGMPGADKQHRFGALQLETPVPTYADLGLNRVEVHRWRRLRNGFSWEELEAEVNQFEKPTISAILGRIPFETILVVPTPGHYSIIYADPPWKYDFAQFQDVQIKYPTLTIEQIIDYKIDGKLLKRDYFDKNAVLFLWAAPPKLVEALTVL